MEEYGAYYLSKELIYWAVPSFFRKAPFTSWRVLDWIVM